MLTFLVATRNPHKVRELRRLLKDASVRLLRPDSFPDIPPAQEDRSTFRGNAVKKAVVASRHTPLPVLAEDSGLEVRALKGRPGVRSARYAGPNQSAQANIRKLLQEMAAISPSRRQARFVCVMALAAGGRLIRTFYGRCAGSIAPSRSGANGFGYDPVFIPKGFDETMAQLGARQKNRVSHRAQAAAKLQRYLAVVRTALPGYPGD